MTLGMTSGPKFAAWAAIKPAAWAAMADGVCICISVDESEVRKWLAHGCVIVPLYTTPGGSL